MGDGKCRKKGRAQACGRKNASWKSDVGMKRGEKVIWGGGLQVIDKASKANKAKHIKATLAKNLSRGGLMGRKNKT